MKERGGGVEGIELRQTVKLTLPMLETPTGMFVSTLSLCTLRKTFSLFIFG